MNALRSLIVLVLALLAVAHSFIIDTTVEDMEPVADFLPKRSPFQHIWRNVQMQMPQQSNKRSESLSRARANAYYRLG